MVSATDSEFANFFAVLLLLVTIVASVYNGYLSNVAGHAAVNFCFSTLVGNLAFTLGVEDNFFFGPLSLLQCQGFSIAMTTAILATFL